MDTSSGRSFFLRNRHRSGTLLGTPNREPQEYSRYIIGIYLPGSLYSIIFLLYSWGSLFGVPSRVPLAQGCQGSLNLCDYRGPRWNSFLVVISCGNEWSCTVPKVNAGCLQHPILGNYRELAVAVFVSKTWTIPIRP